MRIALIADVFPPLRSSGAVQLRDMSSELVRQGHVPVVMVATPDLDRSWALEEINGVQVLRLRAPRTKDMSHVRRALGEFFMPFAMWRHLQKSPFAGVRWDGVIWYSPTIFLGPMANALKKASACRAYLIVRDIFPEWAVDMGLLGRGIPYWFFKIIEKSQYAVADVIGVQTSANLPYFDPWSGEGGRRIEVLQNWLAEAPHAGCSITVADTRLAGRVVFVYAGNMGLAQGMEIFIDLAERLQPRQDVGFLFVGRGSHAHALKEDVKARNLQNVVFFDEVEPAEIPGLYAQCHVGIVALDPRHRTHNIPGKFLSYMQGGLPVLASINPGNDLAEMIEREDVGRVCTDYSVHTLERMAEELLRELLSNDVSERCRNLSRSLFSPEVAARQIVEALVP